MVGEHALDDPPVVPEDGHVPFQECQFVVLEHGDLGRWLDLFFLHCLRLVEYVLELLALLEGQILKFVNSFTVDLLIHLLLNLLHLRVEDIRSGIRLVGGVVLLEYFGCLQEFFVEV